LSLTVFPLANTLLPAWSAVRPEIPLFEIMLLLAENVTEAPATECATRP